MKRWRTRFAPSPTGHLHLGHAYSALCVWHYAGQDPHNFLLRIDDLDYTRSRPEYVQQIYTVLHWLGIHWQQDPQFHSAPNIPRGAVEHRVTRIVDGDTVYTKDGTKIRLHGIDTPERDQPYGKQATRALDRLIETKIFVLEKDTDRYGRLVAVLYTPEGLNVNIEMVCSGHAWWYERYARFDSGLEDCQKSAREARLGLWAYGNPVAPWIWRRR